MKTRNYFIAILIILAIMAGGYYYLDQSRDTEERVYCGPESRLANVCLDRSSPVCGWFDSGKIRCFAYPCAEDFSNECFACRNGNVLYYTPGECPGPGSVS